MARVKSPSQKQSPDVAVLDWLLYGLTTSSRKWKFHWPYKGKQASSSCSCREPPVIYSRLLRRRYAT